jgi:outer membrane protein assembly factor BamB
MPVRTNIWNQLGGSPTGGGFRLLNSIRPNTLRWIVTLPGPSGLCSPVIGPDETIYIGTVNGRLLAVPPDHYVRWNVAIAADHYAVETPAVADDGTVYCLCRSMAIVRDHRTPRTVGLPNFIVAVDPNGTVRWQRLIRSLPDLLGTVNCEIHGAPRVVSGPRGKARIIFVVRYTLIVRYPELGASGQGPMFVRALVIVDERGQTLLFNRYEQEKLFVEATGSGGWPGGATLGEPSLGGLPANASPYTDTPVVFGSFPARERWTIVAPGDKGLYMFKWSEEQGALAQGTKLFALPYAAQPAAFANGLLTGASRNGARFIDSETFTLHVPNPTSVGGPTTVAGGLRQMYFLSRYGALMAIDSNGKLWKYRSVQYGSVAFPALSANHVHIATAGGLHTYSLDLQDVAFVQLPATSAGFSSPAIGPNGDVYVAAGAYQPSPASTSALYAFFDASARRRSAGKTDKAPARPPARRDSRGAGARKGSRAR